MSEHPIDPETIWRSDERPLDDFRRSVSSPDLVSLIGSARSSITEQRSLESLTRNDLPLGSLAPAITDLARELQHGAGFRIVDGFPTAEVPLDEIERLFWGIGVHLGRPVSQSVMGERLGHVRDVTKVDPNARAYRNKSELTPHSDPADILAFLCINPAASGGISRFVSSLAIHEAIREQRPDLLERLYRGYYYHRLGEQQPGRPDITAHRVPVFSEHAGLISCRYVRQYIEVAAAEDPTIELDDLDREAFVMLESLAADPALHHEFTLQPGEVVFANNFTVMHARGSFEDDPRQPPRHLLRLWISTDPMRPVTPHIEHFEGEPGIPPVAGRTPSYETTVEVQ